MTVPATRVQQHTIEPSYSPVSPARDDYFTDEDIPTTTPRKRVRTDVQELRTVVKSFVCNDDNDRLERFRACIDEKGW